MLKLASAEPEWLVLFPAVGDEPAVEVQFAPITIKMVRAARRAAAEAFRIDMDDNEEAGDALSRVLIRRGILAWRGVGDEAGNTIDVSPETIEHFLANPRAFEAADAVYVIPWMERDREGNASAASPSGTGEAATPEPATASSPARPTRSAGAKRTRKRAKAAAPTSGTSPEPKKASASGT